MVVGNRSKEVVLGEVLELNRCAKDGAKGKGKMVEENSQGGSSKDHLPHRSNEDEADSVSLGSVYSQDDPNEASSTTHNNTCPNDMGTTLVYPHDPRFKHLMYYDLYLHILEGGDAATAMMVLDVIYVQDAMVHVSVHNKTILEMYCLVEPIPPFAPSLSPIPEDNNKVGTVIASPPLPQAPMAEELKSVLRNRMQHSDIACQAINEEYRHVGQAHPQESASSSSSLASVGSSSLASVGLTPFSRLPLGPNARAGYNGLADLFGRIVQMLGTVSTFFKKNEAVSKYKWWAWAGYQVAKGSGMLLLWIQLAIISCSTVMRYNLHTFIILLIMFIFCRAKGIAIHEVLFGILEDLAMKGRIVMGYCTSW
ncbi:hypothetical protein DACRYDRAFT_16027 [Dacryopinax primogenitus]|uniref:Uncharacterized protein n=1 Tax=Dacryopinax primogenitus (strain DJM 731) TaxID=1858805 RepID=M5FZH5_DACPD|nr:uncharacterized protein DACRYDRAFT_16027 [Dacryopinax primogenitus]EJU01275.1 hypothetical protein DACRYDRAFT_16027 [Dacryopinax primogenitus]